MGQPIYLQKGGETMIVYGLAQAAVHVGEGWEPVDETINLPAPPESIVKADQKPKPKPRRKTAVKKGK